MAGRSDTAAWKRALRKGRERGCSVYIAAELLERAGESFTTADLRYRVWGGSRGRFIVVVELEPESKG